LYKNIINILVNNLNLYVNQTEDIEKQTTDYIVSWKVFVYNDYNEIINKLRNIGQIRGVKCYTISLDKAEEKEEKNIRMSPWYKHQIAELIYVAIFNMIVISLLIYHLKSNADFMEYI
jgi:hypothetical protein